MHRVSSHAFLLILLEFTRSKGLGEAANGNRLRVWEPIKAPEEGVVRPFIAGQMGKPSIPDTSSVCFDLCHNSCVSGKLRKVELIHEMILFGRGAI
jgi:hypothetical protein